MMRIKGWCVVLAVLLGAGVQDVSAGAECGATCGSAVEEEARDVHAEGEHENHDEHAGHDHAHAEDALSMTMDEMAAARCEHDTEAYRCDNCRYEVGVVRVDASLLKREGNDGGLIRASGVERRTLTAGLDTTGEIRLNDNTTVHITPRISGVVVSAPVDIGERVAKGDELCAINSTELGQAVSAVQRSRSLVELSQKTYEREKALFDQKVGSEQDMIEARMTYAKYVAELTAGEQTLRVFGLTEQDVAARLTDHGPDIGLLPVRAPMDGVILQKHAVAGELVKPGDELMLLANLDSLWVWVDVYEQDLGMIVASGRTKQIPVEITVRAFPDRVFSGSLDYIGAVMDRETRTVKARAVIDNRDGLLRSGMFCRVHIAAGESVDVLAVPAAAVLEDEGEPFVFKHWKDDLFVRRPVTVGRRVNGLVQIIDGVEEGEHVVSEGAFLLKSDVLREKMGAGCAD